MSVSPGEPLDSGSRPEDLLHELRLGRIEAGYELLGRQASVRVWREALAAMRGNPEADLELVAHRTLKRSPEVVKALLDLVETAGTFQAAVIARAVASIRHEQGLVSRAHGLRDELLGRNDAELALASSDGVGALNFVLAHELSEEVRVMAEAASDAESRSLIVHALETEYQRLLELGRTVRWTSGSYRYFLRHALADLALVTEIGGRTGDLAYRLLQQQVDNPEENETLIALLPSTTRSKFLNWALERENANQHPSRTRFALKVAERHLDDVNPEAIASAAASSDPDVAVDALVLAMTQDPGDSRFDAAVAELMNKVGPDTAGRFIRGLLERAPARIKVDLLSTDRRRLLIESADLTADAVGAQICAALLLVDDFATGESLLGDLESLAQATGLSESIFVDATTRLYALAERNPQARRLLLAGVAGYRFREALWTALPTFETGLRAELFRRMVECDEVGSSERRTIAVLRLTSPTDEAFLKAVLDAIAAGALTLDNLDGEESDTLDRLNQFAAERIALAKRELTAVESVVERGRPAAREEVRTAIEPLVAQAVARAEGNDRLRADYQTLLIQVDDETATEDVPAIAWPPEVADEIESLGGRLAGTELSPKIVLGEGVLAARLRYLALLERRSASGEAPRRAAFRNVLGVYAEALGASGDAGVAVADLFEGGPFFRTLFGLNAATRELLVLAALSDGLDVDPAWLSHPQLGDWLAGIAASGGRPTDSESSNPVVELARLTKQLLRVEAEAADLRHEARLAYVADVRQGLDHLELTIDGYVQLWRRLARLGISQIAALGEIVRRDDLDPDRHEVLGDSQSDHFVVRSSGVAVDGEVVAKARMEAELD